MRLTLRRRGAATRWPDDPGIAKQIADELTAIADRRQVDVAREPESNATT